MGKGVGRGWVSGCAAASGEGAGSVRSTGLVPGAVQVVGSRAAGGWLAHSREQSCGWLAGASAAPRSA